MKRASLIAAMVLASCAPAQPRLASTSTPSTSPVAPAPAAVRPIPFRDPAAIDAALRPAFQACYNRELAREASLVGCVSLHVKLSPDGSVSGIVPDATVLPGSLVDCVQREIGARRFEAPTTNPATLVLPVSFVPGGSSVKPTCSSSLHPVEATHAARAAYERALESPAAGDQLRHVREAVAHYRNAKTGWAVAMQQGGDEPRFWHADATYWIVVLQIATNQTPSSLEVDEALATARAVRDGSAKWAEVGAYYSVMIADKVLQNENRRFRESNGAAGIEPRTPPDLNKARPSAAVAVPPQVQAALDARTEYLRRVVKGGEAVKRPDMALSGAQLLLAYGQLDQAGPWLDTAQLEGCALNSDVAPQAKQLRVALARVVGNAAKAERLSRSPTCP